MRNFKINIGSVVVTEENDMIVIKYGSMVTKLPKTTTVEDIITISNVCGDTLKDGLNEVFKIIVRTMSFHEMKTLEKFEHNSLYLVNKLTPEILSEHYLNTVDDISLTEDFLDKFKRVCSTSFINDDYNEDLVIAGYLMTRGLKVKIHSLILNKIYECNVRRNIDFYVFESGEHIVEVPVVFFTYNEKDQIIHLLSNENTNIKGELLRFHLDVYSTLLNYAKVEEYFESKLKMNLIERGIESWYETNRSTH